MMKTKISALVLAVLIPASAAVAVTSADAAPAPASKITAKVSDSTPASGKAFTVSGKFTVGGDAAAAHTVKVQRKVNGSWTAVTGAKEPTNSNGKYSLKIILNSTGERVLRVVGVGQGNESNARQKFTVTVH